MRIDLEDGVVISGSAQELLDLAGDLERAAQGEVVTSQFLTEDGVERFVVRLREVASA